MESLLASDLNSLTIIGLCLVLSAFFSAAETAITSLGTLKAKHLLKTRKRSAQPLKLWITHPGRVLTTILFFNNIVNILASAITTAISIKYFGSQAIGIATGVVTFLVLVFGEIVPKSFAKAYSEVFALFSMRFIVIAYYLGYPFIVGLSSIADWMIRHISRGDSGPPLITEEEIEFIVSEGEKAGVIEDIKKEIIEGAFDFDETTVKEIMTARTDLVALEKGTSFDEVLRVIIKSGHSRIPIFDGHIDQIVGIVLAKDLLVYSFDDKIKPKDLRASDLMRECMFTPETKSIMSAFKDLNRSKNHIAIIIDEYGGTAGIVTMEDIMEEFVGEIQDEFDSERKEVTRKSEGVFEVVGAMNAVDFLEKFHLSPSDIPDQKSIHDVETVSGLVTLLVGQLPRVGQVIQIGKLKLVVLALEKRRVHLVKVEQIKEG